MTRNNPLLTVDNLSVSYQTSNETVDAVQDVSFTIQAGEVLGLVGESGSGKSTISHTLLGLLDDNACISGDIRFANNNIFDFNARGWGEIRGREIGMVFQSPTSSFNPNSTIGAQLIEAIRWHQGLSHKAAKQAAIQALTDVGLPRAENIMQNYAFELSGGMCQRAALAMVLALRPLLILADEPTASLDVVAQAELIKLLKSLQKQQQFAMLIISHDLNLIARLAERVLVMFQGKILEQGQVQQVLHAPAHDYTKQLINAVPRITGTEETR